MITRNLVKCYHRLKTLSRITTNYSQLAAATLPEAGPSDINTFKIGQSVHGFQVKEIQKIDDFNITALLLIHERMKSEYLHLFRNDSNNVFAVIFRTTPKDSTGLPHILEHTVLCGSQLYPVRDPFFKMLNRSLATFMNALTGSDYTMYPFSTQNFTDFQNLQKIYLDAVFRPNLKLLDFMQEGWRLENVDPNDITSPLVIKGVVYNEMKGAFSENESLLSQKLQNLILPDHTYGVISGGDPLKIPLLTWDDLKRFHTVHYHPSNARFYSYGNFPLAPTLDYLNSQYLLSYNFEGSDHTKVPSQKRWNNLKSEHVSCRFENMRESIEKQNTMSISFVLSDLTNVYETFLGTFLSELLIKGPNSAFYKSLIEPNFCGGFTPSTGYDTQPRDTIFTVGLQGLQKSDFEKFNRLFDKTVDDVIKNGFDEKHIESVLHQYELGIKHEATNFGLNLLFGLAPTWNHNGDILNLLKINGQIERLKQEMAKDKQYLQQAVQKFFKDNKHKLILTMSPDMDYEKKQAGLEADLIKEKTKNLTPEAKHEIYSLGLELQNQQNKQHNAAVLPTLQMNDIKNEVERIESEKMWFGPVPTQINRVDTNGIAYFKGMLNTSHLTPGQQMLLPLFCYVITKLGTGSMNYRDFDSLVNRKTAGLHLTTHVGESLYQLHSYETGILLSSFCLNKNADSMWNLWTQIFNLAELKDVRRFEMLVKLYLANLSHGLADLGHAYAMQAAGGLVSGAAYQKELLGGLQHISYMKKLVTTSTYESLLLQISNIARSVFDKNKLRCSLNVMESEQVSLLRIFEQFIDRLPGNTFGLPNESSFVTTKVWTPNDGINCQHHILNVPVYYCSKAVLTAPYTDLDFARLRVLARLITSKYLHPELREKQGAYGGGARISPDGVFAFFSYRDPRNLETLDVFDNACNWIQNELDRTTAQDILEAKLGVFQGIDSPIPPSEKGAKEFLRGVTPDILQRHRAAVMTVDHQALRNVGEKYLSKNCNVHCSKTLLGPKNEKLDTSKRMKELWTVVE